MSIKNLAPTQALVALAVFALHAALFVALLPKPANGETSAPPALSAPVPNRTGPVPADHGNVFPERTYASVRRTSAPSMARDAALDPGAFSVDADPSLRDAFSEGVAFGELATRVAHKRRFSKLGTQFASIAGMAMPDTWTHLEPLARQGDPAARESLKTIARECDDARRRDGGDGYPIDGVDPGPYEPLAPSPSAGRNRTELAFLAGVADHTARTIHAFAQMCREAGISIDRYIAITGDRTIYSRAAGHEAIRAWRLRYQAAITHNPELEPLRVLHRRMTFAGDPFDLVKSRPILARLEGDSQRIEWFAHCLINGCDYADTPALPEHRVQLTAWLGERGSLLALQDAIALKRASGDASGAYAYARYGEWLAAQACYESGSVDVLLDMRRNSSSVGGTLSHGARAAAEQRATTMIRTYGWDARSALGCG